MKKLVKILLAASMCAGLFGCGPKKETTTTNDPKVDYLTTWHTYETQAREIQTWNILYSQASVDLAVLSNCEDSLLTQDKKSRLQPCIATDWHVNDDATEWTFYLRKDVKWVDYQGNEKGMLTAQDFVTGLEWVLNYAKNQGANSSMPIEMIKGAKEYYEMTQKEFEETGAVSAETEAKFTEIVGVSAPDNVTLIYTMLAPKPYFDTCTTYACLYPLAQGAVDEYGDQYGTDNKTIWYNGPYTCTEYENNSYKLLSRNNKWYNSIDKTFESVHIQMVEDQSTAWSLFQSGEIDNITLAEDALLEIYKRKRMKDSIDLTTSTKRYEAHDEEMLSSDIDRHYERTYQAKETTGRQSHINFERESLLNKKHYETPLPTINFQRGSFKEPQAKQETHINFENNQHVAHPRAPLPTINFKRGSFKEPKTKQETYINFESNQHVAHPRAPLPTINFGTQKREYTKPSQTLPKIHFGPKLEFKLFDCLGREWQCGTIQVDYQLPSAERLDATYIGADNQKHHPVMLHRAILGSFERFLGILIENFAGAFPTWLAFEQVAVVPVSSEFDDYAKQINETLLEHDIRSNAYLGDENMKAKIKNISMEHRTPYILVVGEKEKADGTVCVRYRFSSKKPQETMKIDDFVAYVEKKVAEKGTGI